MSNGPYVLAKRIVGVGLPLVKNRYYWDAKAVAAPRIEYVVLVNSTAELAARRRFEFAEGS